MRRAVLPSPSNGPRSTHEHLCGPRLKKIGKPSMESAAVLLIIPQRKNANRYVFLILVSSDE